VQLCHFFCCGGKVNFVQIFLFNPNFWFWREMVFGVTYLVYNTVVWLCQFFCCGGKVNFVRIPYSHNCFSKISRIFFVKKWSHIKPTYEKTNSFLLCMDLQPYSHCCFSKISRTLFDFLNNTYWVSLFLRNNSLLLWTWVSCFSVTLFYSTLFCCGRKAKLVRFTLFYSTLLTLTDRMTDRETN
jgi:hypothetical protein